MRFHVERDVLADAVAWTARSLPLRPPVPVLAGLQLEATDDPSGPSLRLAAFDYEISTQVRVDAPVTETGTVLVSGRLLAEITRSLPAQPVDVRSEGSRLALTCGAARFALPTLPVEDYPSLPQMPSPTGAIGSDAFAAAVGSVAVAAGRDDTLPVLTGVRLEIDGDRLTFAATDRYRLAVRELRWSPVSPGAAMTALVPARTLADTAKAFTAEAEVTVALATQGAGEGMIGFEAGGRRTTTRLLEGEFPKYSALMPTSFSASAELPTISFVEAIKRVSLVAARNAPVRLSFGPEEVVLEAGTGDEAQATEALAVSFDGEPLTIAFNPGYLLDGLGAIDSDVARLAFTAPSKPALLTGKSDEVGDDYRYLLMPVRLAE